MGRGRHHLQDHALQRPPRTCQIPQQDLVPIDILLGGKKRPLRLVASPWMSGARMGWGVVPSLRGEAVTVPSSSHDGTHRITSCVPSFTGVPASAYSNLDVASPRKSLEALLRPSQHTKSQLKSTPFSSQLPFACPTAQQDHIPTISRLTHPSSDTTTPSPRIILAPLLARPTCPSWRRASRPLTTVLGLRTWARTEPPQTKIPRSP